MKINTHDIRDGEVLPVVGGPLDGETRAISVLFPNLDGGVPAAGFMHGQDWYRLDAKDRRFVYVGWCAREAK